MSNFEKVKKFMQTFGQEVKIKASIPSQEITDLRYGLIEEELLELKTAMDNKDLTEIADALTDILYVTYGAGHAFGINLDKCFDEVQNSNMSKLGKDGEPIYNELLDSGAKPFGMFALNSLRIEKGYKTWKGDLSTDYSLLESGLGRFVKFDKPQDFPGKAALLIEKQQGIKKKAVTLLLNLTECDAPYMSTLWRNNKIVGEVTSGGLLGCIT